MFKPWRSDQQKQKNDYQVPNSNLKTTLKKILLTFCRTGSNKVRTVCLKWKLTTIIVVLLYFNTNQNRFGNVNYFRSQSSSVWVKTKFKYIFSAFPVQICRSTNDNLWRVSTFNIFYIFIYFQPPLSPKSLFLHCISWFMGAVNSQHGV